MAVSHRFTNVEGTPQGGLWLDDYGRKICDWEWDGPSKVLTVNAGTMGRRIDLSQHDEHNFTDEKLRERLPSMALAAAEELKGVKYQN